MDLYGMCTLTRGSLSDLFGSLAHGLLQCGGGGTQNHKKIIQIIATLPGGAINCDGITVCGPWLAMALNWHG
jgi:hypothetical protein